MVSGFRKRLRIFLHAEVMVQDSKKINIPDFNKVATKYLTFLLQDSDVILAVLFKHVSVIKDFVFLRIIPC